MPFAQNESIAFRIARIGLVVAKESAEIQRGYHLDRRHAAGGMSTSSLGRDLNDHTTNSFGGIFQLVDCQFRRCGHLWIPCVCPIMRSTSAEFIASVSDDSKLELSRMLPPPILSGKECVWESSVRFETRRFRSFCSRFQTFDERGDEPAFLDQIRSPVELPLVRGTNQL